MPTSTVASKSRVDKRTMEPPCAAMLNVPTSPGKSRPSLAVEKADRDG